MENKDKLNLLEKVLSTSANQDSEIVNLKGRIEQLIDEKLIPLIDNCVYPDKNITEYKIKKIIDSINFYTLFPELLGKRIIGVYGTSNKIWKQLIKSKDVENILANKWVPGIVYNREEKIRAYNAYGNMVNICEADHKQLFDYKEGSETNIYPQNIIKMFYYGCNSIDNNIAYIYIPRVYNVQDEVYDILVDRVDSFIYPVDSSTLANLKIYQKNFKRILHGKKIILAYYDDIKKEDFERFKNVESECLHVLKSEVDKCIENNGTYCNGFETVDRFKLIFSYIKDWYKVQENTLRNRLALLNNDIVNIDEKSLMDITTSIRKEIKHDIDVLTNELASFCRIENDIIEVASKVDDYYWGCIAEKKSVEPSFAILDAWVNMALKGIESGCFEESQLYINKLNLYNYPLTFGLRIYKDFKMNGTINHDNIIMLKSYAGNEQLYYRLLMRMSEPLDLSKKELLELAETIIYPTSGKGCYYKALAVQKSSPKFSEYLMKKSSDLGFQLAKNYILRQAIASNDLNAIESMGNELLPLANYTLAMKVMDKQYAKAVTRLKMAAACEYFPAIKELVRINYQRMIKSNNKKIIAEKLVRVILYVLDKENNAEYCEWAGNLYDVLGDGKRAVEYLKKSETNQSYYKLGTWYKNGINVSRDYNKSLQYYKKASELGHPNADHQVKKVQSIIKQEKQARIVREKQDYATISDEKEQRRKVRRHDDDFCFITSATCQYLKKGDNCEELNLIRNYRDCASKKNKDVAFLVDEYYRIAPSIIQKIDELSNREEIYSILWERYICQTYHYIKNEKDNMATKTYIEMVLWLSDFVHIDIDIRARMIANKILN